MRHWIAAGIFAATILGGGAGGVFTVGRFLGTPAAKHLGVISATDAYVIGLTA